MIEKVGPVRNPLTIIAIFAAVSEISGTVVLPLISPEHQGKFIWFVMLFPTCLVCLFFATLNWNRKALYAPSDFGNEDNFFRDIKDSSSIEREEKLKQEIKDNEQTPVCDSVINEVKGEPEKTKTSENPLQSCLPESKPVTFAPRGAERYMLAEELVLNYLGKEFKSSVRRNVNIMGDKRLMFDGLIISSNQAKLIEVKYFHDPRNIIPRLRMTVDRMVEALVRISDDSKNKYSIIIAVVTDAPETQFTPIYSRISKLLSDVPYPIQVRLFNLNALESEAQFA